MERIFMPSSALDTRQEGEFPSKVLTPWRLLLVEPEENEDRIFSEALGRHGYQAQKATTGRQALESHQESDLVLLDLDLPDLDGLEICRAIRSSSTVPIIIITDRGTELDRVLGLRSGADDYIIRPHMLRETLARIDSCIRRSYLSAPTSTLIVHEPLRINVTSRSVFIGERRVELTRKEFDLLRILSSQPGKVIPRKNLMSHVWGDSWSRRTLDTHVNSIRRKLGDSRWISTARGVGFQFVAI